MTKQTTAESTWVESGDLSIVCAEQRSALQMHAERNANPLRWQDAIAAFQNETLFRDLFREALARAPFEAFFFETPPVSPGTRSSRFEWVLLDAPTLAQVRPDPTPFGEHFDQCRPAERESSVRVFDNLGGDARLVAPCPISDLDHYAHLAAFVRGGPRRQVEELWSRLAETLDERLGASPAPTWVSTSGLGVYWVHVRLDSRPKYYNYRPYMR